MIQFSDKDLRGVPVFTKSGQRVGKLSGFVIETMQHGIVQYVVARARSIAHLLPDQLYISISQVVSLDNEKMIVNDVALLIEAAAAAVRMPETSAVSLSSTSLAKEEPAQ